MPPKHTFSFVFLLFLRSFAPFFAALPCLSHGHGPARCTSPGRIVVPGDERNASAH